MCCFWKLSFRISYCLLIELIFRSYNPNDTGNDPFTKVEGGGLTDEQVFLNKNCDFLDQLNTSFNKFYYKKSIISFSFY